MLTRLARFSKVPSRSFINAYTVRPAVRLTQFHGARFYSSADKQLKQLLKEEIEIVKEIPNELDNTFKDFISENKYEVKAEDGKSNVELTKVLENGEKLSVFFDIDEVTDIPVDEFTEPEQSEEMDFDASMSNVDGLLCSVKVLISKPNNEGLFLNLFLQASESSFLVDFISHKPDVSKFLGDISNGEFLDKVQYQGPRFTELDESIQVGFEQYLESIGVNDELADFILNYSELKEENEYRNWLSKIAGFF